MDILTGGGVGGLPPPDTFWEKVLIGVGIAVDLWRYGSWRGYFVLGVCDNFGAMKRAPSSGGDWARMETDAMWLAERMWKVWGGGGHQDGEDRARWRAPSVPLMTMRPS